MQRIVTPENAEDELRFDIGGFSRDPLGFARYAYWTAKDLREKSLGPRAWQREILEYIGKHLRNRETRFTPCQLAVASGHGIGKSALISMVLNWAMSTCEDTKCVVTANTGTQLATKTAPEVGKWFKKSINAHWFEVKATSITVRDPGHERLWRTDFIPWSIQNTEAFAGLHNEGKRIVLIFDEGSAIPDVMFQVAQGALTDENTEIIWLVFGNPTQNTGPFRECFGKNKHRWHTRQIDSRNVEGTNKAQIQKWIDDYGEDSDFVRVRVRGEFPRAGSSQFIASDTVAACRKYEATGFGGLPKLISVDVARFGDDQTVIGVRQGRKFRVLAKLRGQDTVQVAERLIEFRKSEEPDAIVIDGDGIGAGVIDQLNYRGFGDRLFEFHGGEAADDADMYYNKRAENWGRMRDWLAAGADIPDDAEMDELSYPEYGFSNKNQIQLEKKADMKARGLASPDIGDSLAMSFSVKIAAPKAKSVPVFTYPGERAQSWMG